MSSFCPEQKVFYSAPKEVYDVIPDRKERFHCARVIGWIIIAIDFIIFLRAFILGAWNGIHKEFSFKDVLLPLIISRELKSQLKELQSG